MPLLDAVEDLLRARDALTEARRRAEEWPDDGRIEARLCAEDAMEDAWGEVEQAVSWS